MSSSAEEPRLDDAAQLEELAAERARLWAELNRRLARDRDLESCRGQLAELERSASWRVTAPLRAAKRRAHQARDLADKAQRALFRS